MKNHAIRWSVCSILLLLLVGSADAARFVYNDRASYISDLTTFGYSRLQEGFEDDAVWGSVRSTIPGGTFTAESITSMGITWSSNNPISEVTTGGGPARTGLWGFYQLPHGDYAQGIHDGWVVTSVEPMYAFGGWIDTNTPFAEIDFVLDGDTTNPVDFVDPILGTYFKFFGVIDTDGFFSAEVRELEGAPDEMKFIYCDDVTIGLAPSAFTLDVSGRYQGGRLVMDFTVGAPQPATWAVYLVFTAPTVQVLPLWTVPLPVIDPPMDLPIAFPFPSAGTIGIYTGLFTAGGAQASDFVWIDTL